MNQQKGWMSQIGDGKSSGPPSPIWLIHPFC